MIDIPIIVNDRENENHEIIDNTTKEEGIQKRDFIAQALMNRQLFL